MRFSWLKKYLLISMNVLLTTSFIMLLLACKTPEKINDQKIIENIVKSLEEDPTIVYHNAPIKPATDKVKHIILESNYFNEDEWDLRDMEITLFNGVENNIDKLQKGIFNFKIKLRSLKDRFNNKVITSNFNIIESEKLTNFSSLILEKFDVGTVKKYLGHLKVGQNIEKLVKNNIKEAIKLKWFENDIDIDFENKSTDQFLAKEENKTSHKINFFLKANTTNRSSLKATNFIYKIKSINFSRLISGENIKINVKVNNDNVVTKIKKAIASEVLKKIQNLDNGQNITENMLNIKYYVDRQRSIELEPKTFNATIEEVYIKFDLTNFAKSDVIELIITLNKQ